MSECRFMYENLVNGPDGLAVSSALPGAVGTPAPEALGSAVCYAGGSHTGRQDQVFVVEIDGEGADGAVGQATFRWQRASAEGWEASGVPTGSAFIPLADGVMVKWASGAGQDLYKGDRWSLLAVGRHGEQPLCDRDRDTRWQALGCAAEWVQVELPEAARARARAVVLGDHNLSDAALATLKGTDTPEPAAPLWSFDPAGAALLDGGGVAGSNARATGRTYIDGGLLRYAAPGESCFEDGKLSIQPAASNLWTYSQNFGGGWYLQYVTQQAAAATGPDGLASGTKLEESNTATDPKYIRKSAAVSENTVYVASIFFKKAECQWAHIAFQTKAGAYPVAYFDLANGAAGSVSGAIVGHGIQEIGDGWYRCWAAVNVGSGGYTFMTYYGLARADLDNASAGVVGHGLYVWGAQLELGAVPTAYIPTTSAPASRAADAVRWALPTELRAIFSCEEPAPGAVLDQSAGALAASLAEGAALVMPGMGSAADLSPYAGSHVIKLIDGAGKTAWAWLGAAGTGEALGGELVANGGFASDLSGWSLSPGATGSIVWDAGTIEFIQGASSEYLTASQGGIAAPAGGLHLAGAKITHRDSTAYNRLRVGTATDPGLYYDSGFGSGPDYAAYLNAGSEALALYITDAQGAGKVSNWDDLSLRQVTAPPATGCLVSKTPGGVNGWAYIQSGFNPNAIASWAVYPESQWRAEGTLVVRGWVPEWNGADDTGSSHAIIVPNDQASGLLYTHGSSHKIAANDGTLGSTVELYWVAGTSYDLAARWSSQSNLLQVGYKLSSASTWTWGGLASFDGAFALGDYLNLCYAPGYPCRLGEVELHDSWLGDPLDEVLDPWGHPAHSQALALTRPHLTGFLDQAHKYWRLELRDPDNPEGVIKASLFYLGGSFAPERTFAAGYLQGSAAGRRLTTSEAGKVAGNATALAAFYELSFPRLSAGDAAVFEAMMAAIHDHAGGGLRPLLFTPFADDPGGTVYCLPTAELSRRRLPGGRWELGLRLEEVVRTDV